MSKTKKKTNPFIICLSKNEKYVLGRFENIKTKNNQGYAVLIGLYDGNRWDEPIKISDAEEILLSDGDIPTINKIINKIMSQEDYKWYTE
ncbi:MAG: hypothetical protein WCT77_03000 [Bacteroidota bacterium]|jgi:hypothetical protein